MADVFLSIKYHPHGSNRSAIERISAALLDQGFSTFCVARDLEDWGMRSFEPGELMRLTFAAIDASRLLLVELSEKGVGVGIEAGYAHARGIPNVTAARSGCDLSLTLRAISAWAGWYAREEELPAILRLISDSSAKAL